MNDYPTKEERQAEAQRLLDGLSSQWVADRMSADGTYTIRKSTVRLWRRGDRVPDLENLLRIRDATGRPLTPAVQARLSGKTDPDDDVPVKDQRAV